MPQPQHVLRLKRTDHKAEHLLLNVTSKGPRDLDLKLVATDQDHIYHGLIKDSSAKSLQATNFTGDVEQWKAVLSFALLQKCPDGPRPDFLQGVETVSSISGTTATITLRKNIDGITQRLGTVKLEQDDEKEEIQVFDWVDSAVATCDELRAQLERLQESATSQQDQVARLTRDLDNLVKAKKEHEDEMLSKFAALLNAKKLKIRDQQRLLDGAHIDANIGEEVAETRAASSKPSRVVGASRAGKRKANGSREPVEDGEEDDFDNDGATVATDDNGNDEERLRQDTPETDDGDATEDDDDDDQPSKTSKGPSNSQRAKRAASQRFHAAEDSMDVDGVGSSALPSRSRGRDPTPQPPTTNVDDDDETDDEL